MTDEYQRTETRALVQWALELGVPLSVETASTLLTFLDHVYRWNSYAGLTRVARSDAVRLHILDSLALAPELEGSLDVVDLGSGGGFPGVPLAVTLESHRFTLVESSRRRCNFLREAVRLFSLSGRVRVLEGDAWRVAGSSVFQTIVSRAFLPPEELLRLSHEVLPLGGRLVVMAGGRHAPHEDRVRDLCPPAGLEFLYDRFFKLPGGTETRSLSVFEKART